MKALKLLFGIFFTLIIFSSCVNRGTSDYYDDTTSLQDLLMSHDVWYVDINKTIFPSNNQEIPFLSKAFTISFENGRLYSNNNLVGIGSIGGGKGYQIGYYDTFYGDLVIDHDLDGEYSLIVDQISNNQITIEDPVSGIIYYLTGYFYNNFDYDLVFYDNIEYFLQEYVVWNKTYTSKEGFENVFDEENFLEFTPDGLHSVFRTSKDPTGTNIDQLIWDYVGDYEVFDLEDRDDLKILSLNYDNEGNEEFELSVIDDGNIELYHIESGTTYEFSGNRNIVYKKGTKNKVKPRLNKRFKTNRKTKKLAAKRA